MQPWQNNYCNILTAINSFDERIQGAFNRSFRYFEEFDHASFDKISQALEVKPGGLTALLPRMRKARETIRF